MRRKRRARGAAVVELALIVPVWIALAWASVWLTELVRARLALQESALVVAWELAGAFPEPSSARAAMGRAEARAFEGSAAPPGVSDRRVSVRMEPSTLRFDRLPTVSSPNVPPEAGARAAAFLARGVAEALSTWGLDGPGKVRAEVRARIALPPRRPRVERSVEARVVLWGDDWHLDDGRDVRAVRNGDAASGPEPALTRSVRRLVHLGGDAPGAAVLERIRALPLAPSALPALGGTFVVSHAYRSESGPEAARAGCDGTPGYAAAAGTESGARDLETDAERWLDHPTPQCFDTAPFRDVHAYPREGGSPGNLSMQLFRARGPHFLGCRRPEARDPSSSRGGFDACGAP